ncbi:hypothetical protein BpHYR1_036160 [Brachionus plicatilis]|uniref:Uncharacterized protein n=1 Tax=Brachionus plicatilis TaxID=10195 RepID=A0A3M7ST07_BRAPC|nr:hypothetical protein BpHYR1_036160 [Brachionus plicatilis]
MKTSGTFLGLTGIQSHQGSFSHSKSLFWTPVRLTFDNVSGQCIPRTLYTLRVWKLLRFFLSVNTSPNIRFHTSMLLTKQSSTVFILYESVILTKIIQCIEYYCSIASIILLKFSDLENFHDSLLILRVINLTETFKIEYRQAVLGTETNCPKLIILSTANSLTSPNIIQFCDGLSRST